MLKLNASYSKKVPAEGEYSSQSYHASIEVELPDGLTQEQLQTRIHETFDLVRDSVEAELHGNTPPVTHYQEPQSTGPERNAGRPPFAQQSAEKREIPASPKQIKFMLDLARHKGITPAQIAAQHGVASVEQLTKTQCSHLINEWKVVA